jgi:hypothetical protein
MQSNLEERLSYHAVALTMESDYRKIGKIKEIANHKRNTDKEYVDKRYFDDSYVRKILKEEITKRGK